MKRRAALLFFLALAACEPPPRGAGPSFAPDPEEEGPFPVGVTTVDLLDEDRGGPGEPPRPLRVEVWYPAAPESRKMPRDVIDYDQEAPPEAKAKFGELGIAIEEDAARDAPPETRSGPYPLVVFSHGNFGIRHQSVFATRHWASHGYVVAAVDHTGNTLWDALAGATVGSIAGSAIDRPKDVNFVRREFARGGVDARFAGLVDASRAAVSGHSYGGYTALAAMHDDPTWTASLPMAPARGALDIVGIDPATLPAGIAVFGGTSDRTTPFQTDQVEVYNLLAARPRMLVGIRKGGHFTFAQICDLPLQEIAARTGLDIGNVLDDGCGPEFIAPALAQSLINRYSTAWLNWRLRASAGSRAFLDAPPPAEVELQAALE